MPRTTDLPKAEILAAYEQGETVASLARTYGRDFSTMRENLHRWGASVRRRGPKRKWIIREDYFERIDSEDKAYWLGFILADGSVGHNNGTGYRLMIQLAEVDQDHLAKFAGVLGDLCVQDYGPTRSAYVSVSSTKLCKDLLALGCVRRKTYGHSTPSVDPDLKRHLYRGYTDGDGSLFYGNVTRQWGYSVIGCPVFIEDYQNWLISQLDLRKTKLIARGPVVSLHYQGSRQTEKIARLLYEEATVYLDRKYEIYRRLLDHRAELAAGGCRD